MPGSVTKRGCKEWQVVLEHVQSSCRGQATAVQPRRRHPSALNRQTPQAGERPPTCAVSERQTVASEVHTPGLAAACMRRQPCHQAFRKSPVLLTYIHTALRQVPEGAVAGGLAGYCSVLVLCDAPPCAGARGAAPLPRPQLCLGDRCRCKPICATTVSNFPAAAQGDSHCATGDFHSCPAM